jgi:hypothetical protein
MDTVQPLIVHSAAELRDLLPGGRRLEARKKLQRLPSLKVLVWKPSFYRPEKPLSVI